MVSVDNVDEVNPTFISRSEDESMDGSNLVYVIADDSQDISSGDDIQSQS